MTERTSWKLILFIQPSAVMLSVCDQMQDTLGDALPRKAVDGPKMEAKSSRTVRVAARLCKWGGSRSTRLDREAHGIARFRACMRRRGRELLVLLSSRWIG
jgi:hypothetical protein